MHSSLVDVLLRFRQHRVALVADVSRMYRAIALTDADKDLHRFVWRSSPSDSLKDYRMTRVTFGVSASSFVSNMCVKQNALDLSLEFPLAARAVEDSFYVDDGLTQLRKRSTCTYSCKVFLTGVVFYFASGTPASSRFCNTLILSSENRTQYLRSQILMSTRRLWESSGTPLTTSSVSLWPISHHRRD